METLKLSLTDRKLKKVSTPFAPTLYSETVRLRQLSENDVPSVQESQCHDDIIKTVDWKTIDWKSRDFGITRDLSWATQDLVSSEIFGSITLTELNPTSAELAFTFHCSRWEKRMAFESLRLILDWAFTHFPRYKRIQARRLPTSTSSGALLDDLGMRLEGVNRAALELGGETFDLSCHAMTREDWVLRQENGWSFHHYDFAHI
jgi:RimJ/RimL family protein N-acetyltransferase